MPRVPVVDVSYTPGGDEGIAAVGEYIEYVLTITNAGSVTLSSLEVLHPTVRYCCTLDGLSLAPTVCERGTDYSLRSMHASFAA